MKYGYAGATIEAIAQEAGVAPETIFAVFGNKRTILAKLIDVVVGGDDLQYVFQSQNAQADLPETCGDH